MLLWKTIAARPRQQLWLSSYAAPSTLVFFIIRSETQPGQADCVDE
jgi:hypothetical protein